jgi:hypothetical protein
MSPPPSTAGTRVRYAVTAVLDVYYVGLAGPGAYGTDPGPLPATDPVAVVAEAVRDHFTAHVERAVAQFTRRTVERAELVFLGVATQAPRTVTDAADEGGEQA